MPTKREVMDYIIQSAQARGIDPRISLRVFQQESGFNPAARNVTPRESSWGVTQLNIKGGLGNEARKRGIEPTDPNQWKQHIDFSHDTVKRDGWRQWGGATDTGVSRWQGVGSRDATANTVRPPKNIDLTETPTLKQLSPEKPKTPIGETAEAGILRQIAPADQVKDMARHKYPGYNEAIKQSLT